MAGSSLAGDRPKLNYTRTYIMSILTHSGLRLPPNRPSKQQTPPTGKNHYRTLRFKEDLGMIWSRGF